MAGITGDKERGAISIVVSSGAYADMDRDLGNTIYYSGDSSHDNVDPKNIVHTSPATQSLHKSITTQRPVRVLRSNHKDHHGPPVGIRYDGLYKVVSVRHCTNQKGGLYEQFKLERLPDQKSLAECQKFPTAAQRADYAKIKNGY
jgi:hypothetical protein